MVALCAATLLSTTPARAAGWRARITDAIGRKAVGVSVRLNGTAIYSHTDGERRIPASNEKLLMSIALLSKASPNSRVPTIAAVRKGAIVDGVVNGDVWLLGRGDPTVTDGGKYARSLYLKPTRVGKLARRIEKAGVRKVIGSVIGSTGYFAHDWFAPGWKQQFPTEEVPMPTALTFDGNRVGDTHIADPERRAAQALTKRLRGLGIAVKGRPAQDNPPNGLRRITKIKSRRLRTLLTFMNRQSSNFFAEVLGKRLGIEFFGKPGTIDKGGRAIAAYAAQHGVKLVAEDSSGLSYSNRVSPRGIGKLLGVAEQRSWFGPLRNSLADGGQGTLEDRLAGVRLRAKTGTLEDISALSGWVWLKRVKQWCAFSIMSRGMDKSKAAAIEDKIVRILYSAAH